MGLGDGNKELLCLSSIFDKFHNVGFFIATILSIAKTQGFQYPLLVPLPKRIGMAFQNSRSLLKRDEFRRVLC